MVPLVPKEEPPNLLQTIQQFEREGGESQSLWELNISARLKSKSKKEVEFMVKSFLKGPSMTQMAEEYWAAWIQLVKTKTNYAANPAIDNKNLVTERTAFHRKPSPLVAGSPLAKIDDRKESFPLKEFDFNTSKVARKESLKKNYMKMMKNSGLNAKFGWRPKKPKSESSPHKMAARLRMLT